MFSKVVLARVVSVLGLLGLLALGGVRPARAQFAVIDVASIAQLVQEVKELEQQVETAKSQLAQAQAEYSAITGDRGMQNLLAGTPRNYLPTNFSQLSQVMSGSSGSFPALAAQIQGLITANALLTPVQVSALSQPEQAQLRLARGTSALIEATAGTALSNSSERFASLQELIRAIGTASDEKASLDLTARITAEQAMLQNESTKLHVLYQLAEGQEWARLQQMRERAIADQGSLRSLPPIGL